MLAVLAGPAATVAACGDLGAHGLPDAGSGDAGPAEDGVLDARRGDAAQPDLGPTGLVFERSPDEGPAMERPLAGLQPGARILSGEKIAVYSCVDAARCLDALDCDAPGPCTAGLVDQLAVADDDGHFRYTPVLDPAGGPDPAAEVNAYYHLARFAEAYAALGARALPRPIWVLVGVPEALGVPAGATWFWGGDGLLIGTLGGRNVAYDPDVFGHELAHVLLPGPDPALLSEGISIAVGAVVEGTADYLSCSLLDDPQVGEYSAAALGLPFLSSVDNDAACPADLLGESHVDGQILSGALWEARVALGAEAIDAAVVAMLATLGPGATFEELTDAILAPLDPSDRTTIRAIFERRGLPGCGPVVDVPLGVARSVQLYPVGIELYDPQGDALALLTPMPGGIQPRIEVPGAVSRIAVEVAIDDGEIELDEVTVHLRLELPVAFGRDGVLLRVEADVSTPATTPLILDTLGGEPVAGGRLHVALASEAADFATVEVLVRPVP